MKTLLYLFALGWGAALLYRGLAAGLPGPPFNAGEWGAIAAFGFGALLVLVGLRHVWQLLAGDDGAPGGGSALIVVLAVALTVGAVAWRGNARGPSRECDTVLEHVHALAVAHDPSPESRARLEEARPLLLLSCQRMTGEQRKCPLSATSIDEVKRCR